MESLRTALWMCWVTSRTRENMSFDDAREWMQKRILARNDISFDDSVQVEMVEFYQEQDERQFTPFWRK